MKEKQYTTNEVAKLIGIHVNTVRLYESCGLITKPQRQSNGYRIFTDLHLEQFRLARAALQVEVLQNGLRKRAVDIIKASANSDYTTAELLTNAYLDQIDSEIKNAEEAIEITKHLLSTPAATTPISFTRKEAADYLEITIDTLRNWELNGLLQVKRKENGYRIYSFEDIQRLKIIRSLRCANYSLSAILRMLHHLSNNQSTDIRKIINTPHTDDNVITACDNLLTSLLNARENALFVLTQIKKLQHIKNIASS